jgi:hypothetical protein
MQHHATYAPLGFGTNDVQIMAGSFDDFTFDDVIQVLGLSRQCLRLLVRHGEAAISEVLLKAGQVLDARMPASSEPDEVFQALSGSAVSGSGLSFAVYHTEPTGPYPAPRGRLSDLYEGTRGAAQQAQQAPAAPLRTRATDAVEKTMVLDRRSMQPQAQPAPAWSAPQPAALTHPATMPVLATETLSKAMVADLQPLLHQELTGVLAQLREQAQVLHTLDGRLQALPQLVAAEVRLALAQQERRAAPPAAVPAPAAVAPAGPSGLVLALAAGMLVMFGIVLVLALRVMR